jgi:cytochrome c2
MKLEASSIAETSARMAQIQNQLANLTLQLQDIKKGKEVREEVWCNKCRTKDHSREHCLVFAEYLASGAPNPLPQA